MTLPLREIVAKTPDILRTCRVASFFGALALCGFAEANADEIETTLVAEVRLEIDAPADRQIAQLVPATMLKQGQEIFYTVRIRNTAAVAASNVEVRQRIPENTIYVPGSAAGPGAEISLSADGGATFGDEGQLTVTEQAMPQQTPLTRPATPQDYTHIRWRLRKPLAPGAVALARFRAVFQ